MKALDVELTVRGGSLDDWWVIERAEHGGREWFERTGPRSSALMCSSRIGDADVEGTESEMLALADAIDGHGAARFKRCSATWGNDGVWLSSPRNSTEPTLITHARAIELAAKIRQKVAAR